MKLATFGARRASTSKRDLPDQDGLPERVYPYRKTYTLGEFGEVSKIGGSYWTDTKEGSWAR